MSDPQIPASEQTSTTLKVKGRNEFLGTLASVLGFHPEESIVLTCLTGVDRRLGPVTRVNLPTHVPEGLIGRLSNHAAQFADEVVLVIYSDLENLPDVSTLVSALAAVCTVIDVIRTNNTPAGIPAHVAAAAAIRGRTVLDSRTALNRSIAYQPGTDRHLAAVVLDRLESVTTRDAFLSDILPHAEALPDLITAAQTTPDDDSRVPNLCAIIGVVAYRHGDGALAQVAMDRALRLDPTHRLAHLMLAVMCAGLPPADLDELIIIQRDLEGNI